MVKELLKRDIPVITPAGGLGVHVDAMRFVDHIPQARSALRCAVLCCAALCCAVLCCAVLCCALLRCAVLCCMDVPLGCVGVLPRCPCLGGQPALLLRHGSQAGALTCAAPPAGLRACCRSSTLPARWRLHCTSPAGSAAWSAARCRSSASPTAPRYAPLCIGCGPAAESAALGHASAHRAAS